MSHIIKFIPYFPTVKSLLCKQNTSENMRRDVEVFTVSYLKSFVQFVEKDNIIQQFLKSDKCYLLADNYLLAMTFAYFIRAKIPESQFDSLNFFTALHIAHDMEEDELLLKKNLCNWTSHSWEDEEKFYANRRQMLKKMEFRACVSRQMCEKVMSIADTQLSVLWQRVRHNAHGGAFRPKYRRSITCTLCKGDSEEDRLRRYYQPYGEGYFTQTEEMESEKESEDKEGASEEEEIDLEEETAKMRLLFKNNIPVDETPELEDKETDVSDEKMESGLRANNGKLVEIIELVDSEDIDEIRSGQVSSKVKSREKIAIRTEITDGKKEIHDKQVSIAKNNEKTELRTKKYAEMEEIHGEQVSNTENHDKTKIDGKKTDRKFDNVKETNRNENIDDVLDCSTGKSHCNAERSDGKKRNRNIDEKGAKGRERTREEESDEDGNKRSEEILRSRTNIEKTSRERESYGRSSATNRRLKQRSGKSQENRSTTSRRNDRSSGKSQDNSSKDEGNSSDSRKKSEKIATKNKDKEREKNVDLGGIEGSFKPKKSLEKTSNSSHFLTNLERRRKTSESSMKSGKVKKNKNNTSSAKSTHTNSERKNEKVSSKKPKSDGKVNTNRESQKNVSTPKEKDVSNFEKDPTRSPIIPIGSPLCSCCSVSPPKRVSQRMDSVGNDTPNGQKRKQKVKRRLESNEKVVIDIVETPKNSTSDIPTANHVGCEVIDKTQSLDNFAETNETENINKVDKNNNLEEIKRKAAVDKLFDDLEKRIRIMMEPKENTTNLNIENTEEILPKNDEVDDELDDIMNFEKSNDKREQICPKKVTKNIGHHGNKTDLGVKKTDEKINNVNQTNGNKNNSVIGRNTTKNGEEKGKEKAKLQTEPLEENSGKPQPLSTSKELPSWTALQQNIDQIVADLDTDGNMNEDSENEIMDELQNNSNTPELTRSQFFECKTVDCKEYYKSQRMIENYKTLNPVVLLDRCDTPLTRKPNISNIPKKRQCEESQNSRPEYSQNSSSSKNDIPKKVLEKPSQSNSKCVIPKKIHERSIQIGKYSTPDIMMQISHAKNIQKSVEKAPLPKKVYSDIVPSKTKRGPSKDTKHGENIGNKTNRNIQMKKAEDIQRHKVKSNDNSKKTEQVLQCDETNGATLKTKVQDEKIPNNFKTAKTDQIFDIRTKQKKMMGNNDKNFMNITNKVSQLLETDSKKTFKQPTNQKDSQIQNLDALKRIIEDEKVPTETIVKQTVTNNNQAVTPNLTIPKEQITSTPKDDQLKKDKVLMKLNKMYERELKVSQTPQTNVCMVFPGLKREHRVQSSSTLRFLEQLREQIQTQKEQKNGELNIKKTSINTDEKNGNTKRNITDLNNNDSDGTVDSANEQPENTLGNGNAIKTSNEKDKITLVKTDGKKIAEKTSNEKSKMIIGKIDGKKHIKNIVGNSIEKGVLVNTENSEDILITENKQSEIVTRESNKNINVKEELVDCEVLPISLITQPETCKSTVISNEQIKTELTEAPITTVAIRNDTIPTALPLVSTFTEMKDLLVQNRDDIKLLSEQMMTLANQISHKRKIQWEENENPDKIPKLDQNVVRIDEAENSERPLGRNFEEDDDVIFIKENIVTRHNIQMVRCSNVNDKINEFTRNFLPRPIKQEKITGNEENALATLPVNNDSVVDTQNKVAHNLLTPRMVMRKQNNRCTAQSIENSTIMISITENPDTKEKFLHMKIKNSRTHRK